MESEPGCSSLILSMTLNVVASSRLAPSLPVSVTISWLLSGTRKTLCGVSNTPSTVFKCSPVLSFPMFHGLRRRDTADPSAHRRQNDRNPHYSQASQSFRGGSVQGRPVEHERWKLRALERVHTGPRQSISGAQLCPLSLISF